MVPKSIEKKIYMLEKFFSIFAEKKFIVGTGSLIFGEKAPFKIGMRYPGI